jgi:hypothetical protein
MISAIMTYAKQVYLLFRGIGGLMILDNYKSKVNLHTVSAR